MEITRSGVSRNRRVRHVLNVALRPHDEPLGARDELVPLVSEAHLLRTFLETTPDAVYFKDAQSRFIKISRALSRMFQLEDPDDAIGYADADFFGIEHARQAFEDEMEIVRTGRPLVDFEERETWEDGTE